MAKRAQKGNKAASGECTQFQLHKTQITAFTDFLKSTYDFTEHKLRRFIEDVEDDQKKTILTSLLDDYIKGNVAIAWKEGQPLHVNIIKA